MKLIGSLLVFTGGGLVWWIQQRERRRKGTVLADLALILRQMQEEIRMMLSQLPTPDRVFEPVVPFTVSEPLTRAREITSPVLTRMLRLPKVKSSATKTSPVLRCR